MNFDLKLHERETKPSLMPTLQIKEPFALRGARGFFWPATRTEITNADPRTSPGKGTPMVHSTMGVKNRDKHDPGSFLLFTRKLVFR